MGTLNLGIVAHVDAGKTTLTERLLHAVGVIDEIGNVDDGTTRTDSLALERQRGITIKSAVVSFAIGELAVNLIDTPGHPDFIAEVERVLNVLDGAVLVVSAVEGVQAQTRVLLRTLRRLRIPTLVFVNKIDRSGARSGELLRAISDRLTAAIVPMGIASDVGTLRAGFRPYGPADDGFMSHALEALADHDEDLLAAYVCDEASISYGRLRHHLATVTRRAQVHPVFFGSAITGAGVDALIAGVKELLPVATGDPGGPVSGTVFKVERGRAGEKVAYVRVFSGTVRVRDRLRVHDGKEGKVTGIEVFDSGSAGSRGSVSAGQIAKLRGLAEVRIGDALGEPRGGSGHHFAPPTLETAVVPRHARDLGRLHAALTQLAEQDPLIDLRQDDVRRELYVSLYGEVQKEVIQATLADEYGLDVAFRGSTTLCVERPASTGEAAELLQEDENPFRATIGLRIAPAAPGTGIDFRLRIDPRTAPTHLYRSVDGFTTMMGGYVRATLREGLFGWQVTDCTVAMVRCAYSVADGPPSTRGPDSTPTDFRLLTPLVVMTALRRAGTVVCEPIHRFVLDIPADTLGAVLPALARLDAVPGPPSVRGPSCTVAGEIPAARVHALQQRLAALTRGEGLLESTFHHHQPVRGRFPTRPRTDHNPLNRKQYLLHVLRRIHASI